MDAREPEELPGTAERAEDQTTAKRRARRVSFAETTAVHFFKRDEDCETPPSGSSSGSGVAVSENLVFRGDQSDSDDSRGCEDGEGDGDGEEEEEDEEEENELFVKDMDSSPGSAVGSVASIEDDNLFGPVSASFIRSGQLSEASDDNNHDITLDSTSFSLHFRNVLPSDDRSANSAGSLKTPTGESIPTDHGSFMFPTGAKKAISRSMASGAISNDATSGSSSMSFITEYSKKYDFGKLPPNLEALLLEVNESMHAVSPKSSSKCLSSNLFETDIMDPQDSGNAELKRTTDAADTDVFVDIPVRSVVSSETLAAFETDRSGLPNCQPKLGASSLSYTPVKETSNGMLSSVNNKSGKGILNAGLLSPRNREGDLSIKRDDESCDHLKDQMRGSPYRPNSSPVSTSKIPSSVTEKVREQLSVHLEGGLRTPTTTPYVDKSIPSPFEGSVSSLSAKRRHLFLDASISLQSERASTPFRGQSPYSLMMDSLKHGERISAIKNSILKSRSSVTPKGGGISFKSMLLSSDAKHFMFEAVVDKSLDFSTAVNDGIPFTTIDGHLMGVSDETSRSKINSALYCSGFHTPSNFQITSSREVSTTTTEANKQSETLTSLQPTEPQKQTEHPPISNKNMEEISLYNSSDRQNIIESSGNRQVLDAFSESVPSPLRIIDMKSSLCLEDHLTPTTDGSSKSSPVLAEKRAQSPIFNKPNSAFGFSEIRGSNGWKKMANNDAILNDSGMETRNRNTTYFRNQDSDPERSQHRDNYREQSERAMNISLYESTSSNVPKVAVDTGKSECCTDQMVQTCVKEMDGLIDNDKLPAIHLRDSTTTSTKVSGLIDEGLQDPYASQRSFSAPIGDIVGKKRRNEELPLEDKDCLYGCGRKQKSPRVMPDVEDIVSGFSPCSHAISCESGNAGVMAPRRHWNDILSKVSSISQQWISSPVNTLNTKEIDVLENMLGKLQTARKYERLCIDIQSLKKHSQLGSERHQRTADAKILAGMIVYQRAKLRIMQVKQDVLLKKAQWLQSGLQECHKLRDTMQNHCPPGRNNIIESCLQPVPTRSGITSQGELIKKAASMKKELEILEEKLKGFKKSFEVSCKIKNNGSCDEIINTVNEYLKQMRYCRFIRQDLLLWKLNGILNQNGQCHILLNYCDLLSQRFIIKVSPFSSLSLDNSVNAANIAKKFPNVGALTAFNFVFNTKCGYRLADSNCFRKETQATSFIAGNLLDVLGEIQAAQTEIPNLISSNFCSPSACQLELELSFLNFKSGRKVTLTVDMTNLNCGVYPLERSEMQIKISGTQTWPPSTLEEINLAIRSLNGGHSVITSLCHCVSDIVQASM